MSMMCCMLALTPRQMKTLHERPGLTWPLSNMHFKGGGAEIEEAAEVDEENEDEDDEDVEDDEDSEDEEEDDEDEDEDEEGDEDEDIDLSTVFDEPVRKSLELQTSWDILSALLRKFEVGDDGANELIWGDSIGGDVGYGEASLRDADETKKFARFLQSVDLDRLLSQMNYRELLAKKPYAFPHGDEPDEVYEAHLREDLTHYYPQLRDYVMKAAAARHGLLIWIE